MLSLTEEALLKYKYDLRDTGIIILDSSVSEPKGSYRILKVPILETAQNKVGKIIVANIVALGVLTATTSVVTKEAIRKAVLARVPKGTEELNTKALYEGFKLGKFN